MAKKPIKETIHAKGMDITIYTKDFKMNLYCLPISPFVETVQEAGFEKYEILSLI